MALRMACFRITLRKLRPFSTAVRMKGRVMVSTMEARTMRTT